jgi:hypothetical protein
MVFNGGGVVAGVALLDTTAALQQYKVNDMNKKILLAGALCALAAQGAYAGELKPIVQQVVVAETTSSSAGGWAIILLLLLIIANVSAGASGGSVSVPAPIL